MVTSIQGGLQNQGVEWRTTPGSADQAGAGRRVGKAQLQGAYDTPTMKVTMEVSISAKTETMRLLLQSVVTNIGEALKPYIVTPPPGAQPGQQPPAPGAVTGGAPPEEMAGGMDTSPEATAQRILGFATAFYGSFKTQHGDMGDVEVTDHFLDVIKGGIEQGFSEAREILDGLGVLQGGIATNIDKTYELIQQGLVDFRNRMLGETAKAKE